MQAQPAKIQFTWRVFVPTYLVELKNPTPQDLFDFAIALRTHLNHNPLLWDKNELVSCRLDYPRGLGKNSMSRIFMTWEGPLQSISFNEGQANRFAMAYFDTEYRFTWEVQVPEKIFDKEMAYPEHLESIAYALHAYLYSDAEMTPVLLNSKLLYRFDPDGKVLSDSSYLQIKWMGSYIHEPCDSVKAEQFFASYQIPEVRLGKISTGYEFTYTFAKRPPESMLTYGFSFLPIQYYANQRQMHLMIQRSKGGSTEILNAFLKMQSTDLFERCTEIECLINRIPEVNEEPDEPNLISPIRIVFRTDFIASNPLIEGWLRQKLYAVDDFAYQPLVKLWAQRKVPMDCVIVSKRYLVKRLETYTLDGTDSSNVYDILTGNRLQEHVGTQPEKDRGVKFVRFKGEMWTISSI